MKIKEKGPVGPFFDFGLFQWLGLATDLLQRPAAHALPMRADSLSAPAHP
jgi:hypothetical protein